LRLPSDTSVSISLETGIQNSGLALLLVFSFFVGNGGMALMAAWWSIWHLISALIVALAARKTAASKVTPD
jgi:BASS family bile acid:Na+ symporter